MNSLRLETVNMYILYFILKYLGHSRHHLAEVVQ
jgi:hypothetical protein